MNTYLGIDYGTKKIGIALSDDRGKIAFPYTIIPNNLETFSVLVNLIKEKSVSNIVVGQSTQLDGTQNNIQTEIEKFTERLSTYIDTPIFFENEWFSSVSARVGMYGKGNIANPKWTGKQNQKKRSAVDDNAAAIILQRYLDKQ